MIYSGHGYCLPNQRGDGGFQDRVQFCRYIRLSIAHHLQRTRRSRDLAPESPGGGQAAGEADECTVGVGLAS